MSVPVCRISVRESEAHTNGPNGAIYAVHIILESLFPLRLDAARVCRERPRSLLLPSVSAPLCHRTQSHVWLQLSNPETCTFTNVDPECTSSSKASGSRWVQKGPAPPPSVWPRVCGQPGSLCLTNSTAVHAVGLHQKLLDTPFARHSALFAHAAGYVAQQQQAALTACQQQPAARSAVQAGSAADSREGKAAEGREGREKGGRR